MALDFDKLEEQERALDQLRASQKLSAEHSPEEAAPALDYARRAGVSFEASVIRGPEPADWGRLVKDHPVLSRELSDAGFAAAARDDVKQLSAFERLFGGWSEAVDVVNWRHLVERDSLHKELALIGNAEREGRATPEQAKRADEAVKAGFPIRLSKNPKRMNEFFLLEEKFQIELLELGRAAETGQKRAVRNQAHKLLDACVGCHEKFRR